jgi:hypothetical protein
MPPRAALFYNVFLPPENRQHALDIVSEQLELIRASAIARISQNNLTIYYNTMGSEGSKEIKEMCQNNNTTPTASSSTTSITFLHCVHMKHYPRGDEFRTLQALYEYCQRKKNNDNNNNDNTTIRVGYLHNKGSFHDNPENAKLRIPLTQAIVSEACWNPPNASCTSCGLVFLDLPFMTMPGNFFVSRCDYIIKLLPPVDFEPAMQRLMQTVLRNHTTTTSDYLLLFNTTTESSMMHRESWTGLGRYASEHWAHSHPHVVPCDMSQRLKVFFRPQPPPLNWKLYPRPALDKRKRNMPQLDFSSNGFFGIAGQVYKWYFLYDEVAPPDSWVWARLQGGEEWRDAIIQKKGGRRHQAMMDLLSKKRKPASSDQSRPND